LIDSVKATVLSWHQTFHQHGYRFSISELQQESGRDPDAMIRALLPAADAARLAPGLKEAQRSCYRRSYLERVKPFPVARILLERAKRMDYSVALVSCSAEDELRHYVHLVRISGFIDTMACGDDVAPGDPQLDLVYLVLARSGGVPPNDAVMIGDTPFDAIAARRAGLTAIGLQSSGFGKEELRAAGCIAVYRNLAALLDTYFKFHPRVTIASP
jgi:phosphoglycolate phosphatase-like HAD superfamily hydrolase